MKSLRSIAVYTRKDQIGNTKIREELKIFNLKNTILKSRSSGNITCNEWKTGRQIPMKILTCNAKRERNIGRPPLRWRNQYNFQGDGTDHVWPNPLGCCC
jgi:hypothetical protein